MTEFTGWEVNNWEKEEPFVKERWARVAEATRNAP